MTVPVWPEACGWPTREGFEWQLATGAKGTAPDRGPLRIRRPLSQVARPVTIRTLVDWDGRARFERFLTEDIDHGTLPFLFPDPTRHGVRLAAADGAVLTTPAGRPIVAAAWWLMMLDPERAPQAAPRGGALWSLTVSAFIMP